jgi:D-arabinose 1-dehydrogenase-like Zn-dependent alcohol dehydrogenase
MQQQLQGHEAQHCDEGFHAGWLPYGNFATNMSKANDSIVGIDPHNVSTPQTGPVICNHLTSAHILVLQLPKAVYRSQEELFSQKLEFQRFAMFLST